MMKLMHACSMHNSHYLFLSRMLLLNLCPTAYVLQWANGTRAASGSIITAQCGASVDGQWNREFPTQCVEHSQGVEGFILSARGGSCAGICANAFLTCQVQRWAAFCMHFAKAASCVQAGAVPMVSFYLGLPLCQELQLSCNMPPLMPNVFADLPSSGCHHQPGSHAVKVAVFLPRYGMQRRAGRYEPVIGKGGRHHSSNAPCARFSSAGFGTCTSYDDGQLSCGPWVGESLCVPAPRQRRRLTHTALKTMLMQCASRPHIGSLSLHVPSMPPSCRLHPNGRRQEMRMECRARPHLWLLIR